MKTRNKKFIYLISPNKIINNSFYNILNQIFKSKKVKFFQLRLKKESIKKKIIIAKKILKICKKKPVSLEVFADNYHEMKKQAFEINKWAKNVYVKIPIINSKGKFMGKIIK